MVSQIRAAGRLLRERRFDLLVFRIDVFPFVPFYLTRRHRLPYVIKTLGTGALDALERRGALARMLAPLNRWMFHSIVSRALVADTDSDGHAVALRRRLGLGEREIVWIDNAVNTGRFHPMSSAAARRELGLERFDPLIGYVGSRPWERGGAQLIEAAAKLLPRHPALGVVIVGSGEPVEGMKRRAAELGIAERCHFAGYVPYRRIPRIVQSLDIGVSISLLPERAVNSELKVRQYLACGKPIVISPGGNEFVREQGFGTVVEPGDLDAIAAALERWLARAPAERDAFAARAAALHARAPLDGRGDRPAHAALGRADAGLNERTGGQPRRRPRARRDPVLPVEGRLRARTRAARRARSRWPRTAAAWERALAAIEAAGWKRARPRRGGDEPGVAHFFGFEPGQERLLHLHLHDCVLSGEDWINSHALPLRRRLSGEHRRAHGVRVPSRPARPRSRC